MANQDSVTAPDVHHVGLTVSDLDRSIAFYERLGFERATEPRELQSAFLAELAGIPGIHVRVAHLRFADRTIELVEPLGATRSDDPAPDGPISLVRIGGFHFAVRVDDVDSLHAELVRSGVLFRSAPVAVVSGPNAGRRLVFALDPDGNVVELIQLPDGAGH